MLNSRNQIQPLLAMMMISSSALMILFLEVEEVKLDIVHVIVVAAGAMFFSGLSMLFTFIGKSSIQPLVQINFNENQTRKNLEKIIDAEYREVDTSTPSWDTRAESLVAADPILALAKVRIDLEQELRRLAFESGTARAGQQASFNINRMIEALEEKGHLHKAAAVAIRDILPICNRAIHGDAIDISTARNVTELAAEVMIILRGANEKRAVMSKRAQSRQSGE